MMIFSFLRVAADAEGGLKNRAHLRPVLQGFGGGQPPTSTRRVYTGALLATTERRRRDYRESMLSIPAELSKTGRQDMQTVLTENQSGVFADDSMESL